MRKHGKIDLNQPEIVKALRQVGAEVTSIADMGNGIADILVSFRRSWYVIEIKNGELTPSAQKLKPMEAEWISRQMAPVGVCNSVDAALRHIGAI